MRKLLFCAVLLLFARCAFAQSTTVSGTISDLSGQSWNNGTFSFVFRVAPTNPTAQYFWNGAPFSKTQTFQGALNGSGHFSVSLPSNTSITPSGSSWDLTVCPISKGNSQCFTVQSITITGATQDLTSVVIPPAISIDLAHPAYPFVVAYKHQELTTAPIGGIYYDFTLFHYYICETIVPTGLDQGYGTCSNWVQICQQGDVSCGGGTSTNESFQHNGTLVGTQPIFNIIDSGTVTATVTNDTLNNRVNMTLAAAGGGSGCTLPGHDTGVLSEHPAGTCYDSLDFTWDDRASKQNLIVGNGTSTVNASNELNFLFSNNNVAGANTLGAFVAGDSNTVSGGSAPTFEFYILGDANNLTNSLGSSFIVGEANNIKDVGQDNFAFGLSNSILSGTPGSRSKITGCYLFGDANALTYPAGNQSQSLNSCYLVGLGNQITGSVPVELDSMAIMGESNIIHSTVNGMSGVHILGASNTVEDTLAVSDQVEIVGESNDVDGSISTVQILGFKNVAHNVSAQATATVNTTLVGSANTATNTGATGNPAYQETFGHLNNLHDCTNCLAIGGSVNESSNNTMGIGMSASPEIIITPGVVNIAAWPVSKEIVFTFCAVGCTLTGTPCTASGGSYHDCQNTVTFSSLGTFADTNYVPGCVGVAPVDSANPGQPGRVYMQVLSQATGSLVINTVTTGSGDATWGRFACTLVHR